MTGRIAKSLKKVEIVRHFGTIYPYLCGAFEYMDGICKNYANLRVNFTHWHGSCSYDKHMSTVR